MKVAIITDTHYGVRNDSLILARHQNNFFYNVFLPELKQHGIKRVLHLGDLYDRRKYINFITAKNVEENFIQPLIKEGIEVDIIVGNHDTFYKNTNEVNSVSQMHENRTYSDKFRCVWKDPKEIDIDGCKILLCPWISDDNRETTIKALATTKATVVMGHFEILGFEMNKGSICEHGDSVDLFERFQMVFSGHFHHKSQYKNVYYLGAPYEMTWNDYNDPRGFHIFDTETYELEFIRNPYSLFHRLDYEDSNLTIEEINELDASILKDTYVKIIVKNKTNPYLFDLFFDKIQQAGVADLKVVDESAIIENIEDDDLINQAQDTITILSKYIDGLDIKNNKKQITNLMRELYQEALSQ